MIVQGNNFSNRTVFQYRTHNKQYCYPLHVHQFAELIFMLEGETQLTVDKKVQILREGECAFILPFQTHSFFSKKTVKLGMYLFSPNLLSDFTEAYSGKVGERSCFKCSPATELMHKLSIMDGKDLSLYSVKSFLYSVVSDYLREVPQIERYSDNHAAAKVGEWINFHFDEDITLDDVAQSLGYSRNYLSHCIKQTFGMNFCSLVASLRVDKARRLLAETDKSSMEICFDCGFGSTRTFHRQFKDITGKTPNEYRGRYRVEKITDPGIVIY
ncbi:MAG: helix-turn-helix domain-containing protein [Clostridia bacterium]|nr:helix-turn-helix domain-containing protein [Clostridia bacterium]